MHKKTISDYLKMQNKYGQEKVIRELEKQIYTQNNILKTELLLPRKEFLDLIVNSPINYAYVNLENKYYHLLKQPFSFAYRSNEEVLTEMNEIDKAEFLRLKNFRNELLNEMKIYLDELKEKNEIDYKKYFEILFKLVHFEISWDILVARFLHGTITGTMFEI